METNKFLPLEYWLVESVIEYEDMPSQSVFLSREEADKEFDRLAQVNDPWLLHFLRGPFSFGETIECDARQVRTYKHKRSDEE